MTNDMLVQLCGWVGLILASPMLFRMSYLLVTQIARAIWKTKVVTIRHAHDGKLMSSVTLKLDSKEPLVRQLNAIQHGKAASSKQVGC